MPWRGRIDWPPNGFLHADDLNNYGFDDRTWGGDVNGGGYRLSNVILAGAGGFEFVPSPLQVTPGSDGRMTFQVGPLQSSGSPPVQTQVARWAWGADNSAESGGNQGSNFFLSRYSDTGLLLSSPLSINRASGVLSLGPQTWFGAVNGNGQTLSNVVIPGYLTDPTTTPGDLLARGASAVGRLGIGADGQVLTADSTQPAKLKWAPPPVGFADPTTTKGDLIVHGATTTRMGVGTDGQILTADSTQALGVKWAPAPVSGVPTTRQILTTAPLSGGGDLSADRTLAIAAMGASGAGHATGIVPDPGATAGATRFLREDATWAVPAGGTGGSANPGGSPGNVQFNSAGAFGGSSLLFWDTANSRLGVGTSAPLGDLHVHATTNANMLLDSMAWALAGAVGINAVNDANNANIPFVLAATTLNLRVNNVGIGTATPAAELTVFGAGQATPNIDTAGALGGAILLQDSVNNTSQGGMVLFGFGSSIFGAIKGLAVDGSGNGVGDLAISLRASGANGTLTPAMYFRYQGNVGIGVVPSYKLDVNGDVNIPTGSSYRINGVPISTGGGSQTPWTQNINAAGFQLQNAGAIGIGTATPVYSLDVVVPVSKACRVDNSINDGSGRSQSTMFVHSDEAYLGGGAGTADWTGCVLRVTSYPNNTAHNAGYVFQCGTSASDETNYAEFFSVSSQGVVTVRNYAQIVSGWPRLFFNISGHAARPNISLDGSDNFILDTANASSQFIMSINGSGKLNILSSGQIGMNTNSPTRQLQIYDLSSGKTQLALNGSSAQKTGLTFIIDSSELWHNYVQYDGSTYYTLYWDYNGSKIGYLKPNGDLSINGVYRVNGAAAGTPSTRNSIGFTLGAVNQNSSPRAVFVVVLITGLQPGWGCLLQICTSGGGAVATLSQFYNPGTQNLTCTLMGWVFPNEYYQITAGSGGSIAASWYYA